MHVMSLALKSRTIRGGVQRASPANGVRNGSGVNNAGKRRSICYYYYYSACGEVVMYDDAAQKMCGRGEMKSKSLLTMTKFDLMWRMASVASRG